MFLSLKEDKNIILSNFCVYVPHKVFVNMIPQVFSHAIYRDFFQKQKLYFSGKSLIF